MKSGVFSEYGKRKGARYWTYGAIETEFAGKENVFEGLFVDESFNGHDRNSDREIKGCSGLSQISRSEVDDDASTRKVYVCVFEGAFDAFACFLNSGIG